MCVGIFMFYLSRIDTAATWNVSARLVFILPMTIMYST